MKRLDKQYACRLLILMACLSFGSWAGVLADPIPAANTTNGIVSPKPDVPAVAAPELVDPVTKLKEQVQINTKSGAIEKIIEKPPFNIIEKPPFKIANSLSRRFQKYFGITSTSEFVIEKLLQRLLKKLFGGKVSVKVRTYSFTDLVHMKVRMTKVRLVGSHYKDVPLGTVEVESKTPVMFVLTKRKKLDVKFPALFSFKMQVTEKELDQMLHSERVTNSLRALRLDLAALGPGLGEQRLQMFEPIVTLEDKSIIVKTMLSTQNADPSTAAQLTVSGQPKLYGDDRIFLENVYVDSPDITEPEKFSKFVENLINPLVNLRRFDKPNFALRLDEITVKDKTVFVRGRVLIAPKIPSD